jgi:hypothetical protein
MGAGLVVGIGVAAAVAYYMFDGGGGLELPKGRYPVILLVALAVGPPLIAGVVAGGATYVIIFAALKPIEASVAARRYRDQDDKVAKFKAMIAAAPPDAGPTFVAKQVLPALRDLGATIGVPLHGSANQEKYTVFHMVAATGNTSLIAALAAEGPKTIARAQSGKQFYEIGTEHQRSAILAAFARGFADHLANRLADQRPSTEQIDRAAQKLVADLKARHSRKKDLDLKLDPRLFF